MTFSNSIRLILNSLLLGVFYGLIALALVTVGNYINRYVFKKDNYKSKKDYIILSVFIAYMLTLMTVTFLDRSSFSAHSSNLSLFSSYREAWAYFSRSSALFLILNIIMTIPLGFLLPLLNKQFKKLKDFLPTAFIIVLSIELFQLILKRGIFDIDDIFNNLLGALIGYGIYKMFIHIKRNKSISLKKLTLYLAPLILTLTFSISVYTFYQVKPYGNLNSSHYKSFNMKHVEFSIDDNIINDTGTISLNDNTYSLDDVPMYQKVISKTFTGSELFHHFTDNQYSNEIITETDWFNSILYQTVMSPASLVFDESTQFLEIRFLNHYDSNGPKVTVSLEQAINDLKYFNIEILNVNITNQDNMFTWDVQSTSGNQFTSGILRISYMDDGQLASITHNIGTYDEIAKVSIKSPQQALAIVQKGHLPIFHLDSFQSLKIINIKLNYMVDSKHFLQPVYEIETLIDNEKNTIYIPALKS